MKIKMEPSHKIEEIFSSDITLELYVEEKIIFSASGEYEENGIKWHNRSMDGNIEGSRQLLEEFIEGLEKAQTPLESAALLEELANKYYPGQKSRISLKYKL